MSTSGATVTGKTGPARTVTSQVLSNVTEIDLQIARNVVFITSNGKIFEFDLAATTTFTISISGANGVYTVTISQ